MTMTNRVPILETDREHEDEVAAMVREVLGGRLEAYGRLVELFERPIMASVARRLPRQDVDSVSQEIFVAAYRSLPRLGDPKRFGPWLFRIAARQCCNYWRKREAEGKYRDYGVSPEETACPASTPEIERGEDVALVKALLNRLDAEDRMLVTLLFFEEMSLGEAAAALGWGYVKTKVRYFRAKKKMRDILKKMEVLP